jgi:hypothetical protein
MAYGVDAAFGLKPISHKNGSGWNGQFTEYPISSLYDEPIFLQDPIYFDNTGTIRRADPGLGNPIMGVFLGVRYTSKQNIGSQGNAVLAQSWPGVTGLTLGDKNAVAQICDDPTVLYSIQADASLNFGAGIAPNINGGVQANQLFQNANLIYPLTPNPLGRSYSQTSLATLGLITAQPTAQLKIVGLDTTIGVFRTPLIPTSPNFIYNDFGVRYNNVLVMINNNPYNGGTGTAGPELTASGTLTAAEITVMHTAGTEVEIIAPANVPANMAVVINSFEIIMAVSGTAYTSASPVADVFLEYSHNPGTGRACEFIPGTMFTTNTPGPFKFDPLPLANIAGLVAHAGQGIYLTNSVNDFAAGTSTYNYVAKYSLVKVLD